MDVVLALAKEYAMEQLVHTCEALLLSRPVSLRLLLTAERHHLCALQERCVSQLGDDLSAHFKNTGVGQLSQEMDTLGLNDSSKYRLMGARARQCERDALAYRQRAEQGGAGLKYTAMKVDHDTGQLAKQAEKIRVYEAGIRELCKVMGTNAGCSGDACGRHLVDGDATGCQVCQAYTVLQSMAQLLPPEQQTATKIEGHSNQAKTCCLN